MRSRRDGAAILAVVFLAILAIVVAATSTHAEGSRPISAVPNGMFYIRTADIEGPLVGGEVVDLTTATASIAAGFGSNHRSFSVCIENESTTADENLLVQFQSVGGFAATTLTTPADSTVSKVIRIRSNMQPVCVDIEGVGWLWQCETATVIDANALVTW